MSSSAFVLCFVHRSLLCFWAERTRGKILAINANYHKSVVTGVFVLRGGGRGESGG